jgi:PAS domain S-box-containing protein
MHDGARFLRGARILVVEDDPHMRRTLELLLSGQWEIEAVADGRAALAAAVRRPPDLVLSDLTMPGLDGFGLVRELRADPRTRMVPFIAISGLDQEEARIRALESGASDFLIKPFSERELHARVATQLEMARLRREALERESEQRFRMLVEAIKDYAICMLDAEGRIVSWNAAAEAIHGYREDEILGRPFSLFHPPQEEGWTPDKALLRAAAEGRLEDEGWRVRKDGSRFWANTVLTPIHDEAGRRWGFAKITRDLTERKRAEEEIARLNADLERRVRERTGELEAANAEMEAFSYSVSHDLRAPLRAIDGFSQALTEDCAPQLGPAADYLRRIRAATRKMAELIDGLLDLSRVSRAEMRSQTVDLSAMARQSAESLQRSAPERRVKWVIADGLTTRGDPRLLRAIVDNLLGNAWKFTGGKGAARIEFGVTDHSDGPAYFVADDGAGFDMAYADKLFRPFQRLHSEREFEGTGIGLATVKRVIHRHGGRIWAEAGAGRGATFFFTLPPSGDPADPQ